jgi:hypothetical protein
MSLENIDEKFKKVATGFKNKNTKTPTTKTGAPNPLEEKELYEDSFEKKPVTGLLSVFENHLREQAKNLPKNDDSSDEEFRTISVTESDIVSSNPPTEKVSEEEIDSLISFSKQPTHKKSSKNTNNIVDVSGSKVRYDENHTIQDKVASVDDLNTKYGSQNNLNESNMNKYTDSTPIINNTAAPIDSKQGFKPVNVTKKTSNTNPPLKPEPIDKYDIQVTNDGENDSLNVETAISAKEKKDFKQNKISRRAKLKQSLPSGYIVEDKN